MPPGDSPFAVKYVLLLLPLLLLLIIISKANHHKHKSVIKVHLWHISYKIKSYNHKLATDVRIKNIAISSYYKTN